jgi:hypothetical protein
MDESDIRGLYGALTDGWTVALIDHTLRWEQGETIYECDLDGMMPEIAGWYRKHIVNKRQSEQQHTKE